MTVEHINQILSTVKKASAEHKKNLDAYKNSVSSLKEGIRALSTELESSKERFVLLSGHNEQKNIQRVVRIGRTELRLLAS